jgi:hypothetical protein
MILGNLFGILIMLALAVMLYSLWMVFSMRKLVGGGVIGRRWTMLTGLILLFAGGYAVTPLIAQLSGNYLRIAVAGIFLFGSVYVLVTLQLLEAIIRSLRS